MPLRNTVGTVGASSSVFCPTTAHKAGYRSNQAIYGVSGWREVNKQRTLVLWTVTALHAASVIADAATDRAATKSVLSRECALALLPVCRVLVALPRSGLRAEGDERVVLNL